MTLSDRSRIAFASLFLAGFLAPPVTRAEEPPSLTTEGYQIPRPHPTLRFPADHGSHPGYRIEWWYLTGHLFSGEGEAARRFGVQATFFRLAQRPGGKSGEAAFGDDQMYLAHFAVSDVEGNRFLHEERLNRSGWDAGASDLDLDIWNGNWTLRRIAGLEAGLESPGIIALSGTIRSEATVDLELVPAKPAVLFGENGVSRKGDEAEAASLYLTFPRLTARGTLRIDGKVLPVTGELWMDHEVSSSQLGRDEVGWDWVSVQFFDGRELMAYVLRQGDGSPSPYSSLAWIGIAGTVTHLSADKFAWEPRGIWESPETGSRYPIRPRFSSVDPETGAMRTFSLRPVMDHQEMTGGLGGVTYWEGACDVLNERDAVVGRAYLELTGYAGDDLGTRLRTN